MTEALFREFPRYTRFASAFVQDHASRQRARHEATRLYGLFLNGLSPASPDTERVRDLAVLLGELGDGYLLLSLRGTELDCDPALLPVPEDVIEWASSCNIDLSSSFCASASSMNPELERVSDGTFLTNSAVSACRTLVRRAKARLDDARPLRDDAQSKSAGEFIALVAANVEPYLDYYCHEISAVDRSSDADLIDAIESSLSEITQWRWFFVQARQYQKTPATDSAVAFSLMLARMLYVARSVPSAGIQNASYVSCVEMKRAYASPKFRDWRGQSSGGVLPDLGELGGG